MGQASQANHPGSEQKGCNRYNVSKLDIWTAAASYVGGGTAVSMTFKHGGGGDNRNICRLKATTGHE